MPLIYEITQSILFIMNDMLENFIRTSVAVMINEINYEHKLQKFKNETEILI